MHAIGTNGGMSAQRTRASACPVCERGGLDPMRLARAEALASILRSSMEGSLWLTGVTYGILAGMGWSRDDVACAVGDLAAAGRVELQERGTGILAVCLTGDGKPER
jgi:hypothetical protein